MITATVFSLKGWHPVARGNAPGTGEYKLIVREMTFLKGQVLSRTEERGCPVPGLLT